MKSEHQPLTGDALSQVRTYHQRSKHAFGKYAASPGFLDWETQPDPFRRYEGAAFTELPLLASGNQTPFADLFTPGKIQATPLNLESVGVLLELSFGLAAWKQYGGDRWALRCNPSSGNLHPTEVYLIASSVAGLADGLHHYQSHDHGLEHRCDFSPPSPGLLVGFSSIHWREAWKYGERAFRYCQHDIGHAIGALRYAAALLGWKIQLLTEWADAEINELLGLNREEDYGSAEREAADLLIWIDTGDSTQWQGSIETLLQASRAGQWHGRANALSRRHEFEWPVIEEASLAAEKPRTPGFLPASVRHILPTLPKIATDITAAELIKQRRSAQGFDGQTALSVKAFYRILDATLPRNDTPPLDVWPWPASAHLILFVHRVTGLPPGLYFLKRNNQPLEFFSSAFKPEMKWERPADCPDHLQLFHLVRADGRKAAKTLSCQQDIAGDSAFSLGMLVEYDAALNEGPWHYRRLFWECGLIGQVLYLEAEAAGMRGTGIGCFFDDGVHELLGIDDTRLQSFYHFTIGSPVVDDRLQSLPGYFHLQRSNS